MNEMELYQRITAIKLPNTPEIDNCCLESVKERTDEIREICFEILGVQNQGQRDFLLMELNLKIEQIEILISSWLYNMEVDENNDVLSQIDKMISELISKKEKQKKKNNIALGSALALSIVVPMAAIPLIGIGSGLYIGKNKFDFDKITSKDLMIFKTIITNTRNTRKMIDSVINNNENNKSNTKQLTM